MEAHAPQQRVNVRGCLSRIENGQQVNPAVYGYLHSRKKNQRPIPFGPLVIQELELGLEPVDPLAAVVVSDGDAVDARAHVVQQPLPRRPGLQGRLVGPSSVVAQRSGRVRMEIDLPPPGTAPFPILCTHVSHSGCMTGRPKYVEKQPLILLDDPAHCRALNWLSILKAPPVSRE